MNENKVPQNMQDAANVKYPNAAELEGIQILRRDAYIQGRLDERAMQSAPKPDEVGAERIVGL